MQCNVCGLPYNNASYGGPGVCPACDCGNFRDGIKWAYRDTVDDKTTIILTTDSDYYKYIKKLK